MKELPQRVVILNNFSSPYIKEAIIVLKEYNPSLDSKAVADAEMIVSRYIEKMHKNGQPQTAVRKNTKLIKLLAGLALTALICVSIKLLI